MKNLEIARSFDLIGDLLELKGENPFRVRAYRRAAQNLSTLTEDVGSLAARGQLDDIPGVGPDLAGKIDEYLKTGHMETLEALRREVPAGLADLMSVPGVGPKTARLLHDRLKLTDLAKLEALARAGKLRGLPGIQAKTEQNLLKGIALVRRGQARMPLGRALPLAEEIARALARVSGVKRVEPAGSVRRRKETVGDLDILVTSTDPTRVMDAFVRLPQVARRHRAGPDQGLGPAPRGHPGGPARGGAGGLRRGASVLHGLEGAQHPDP